jgi:hypothetical protein
MTDKPSSLQFGPTPNLPFCRYALSSKRSTSQMSRLAGVLRLIGKLVRDDGSPIKLRRIRPAAMRASFVIIIDAGITILHPTLPNVYAGTCE